MVSWLRYSSDYHQGILQMQGGYLTKPGESNCFLKYMKTGMLRKRRKPRILQEMLEDKRKCEIDKMDCLKACMYSSWTTAHQNTGIDFWGTLLTENERV